MAIRKDMNQEIQLDPHIVFELPETIKTSVGYSKSIPHYSQSQTFNLNGSLIIRKCQKEIKEIELRFVAGVVSKYDNSEENVNYHGTHQD
jgi:hypothetical protein